MPTYERLDYGSPDGSQWGGVSTDAIGYFGTVPVSQYPADAYSTSSYTVTSVAGTSFGFTTAASFNNLVGTVSSIRACLVRYGLMP